MYWSRWLYGIVNKEAHLPDLAMALHYNLQNPSYYHSHCVDSTLIRVAFVFEEFGALSFSQVLRLVDFALRFVYITPNVNWAPGR